MSKNSDATVGAPRTPVEVDQEQVDLEAAKAAERQFRRMRKREMIVAARIQAGEDPDPEDFMARRPALDYHTSTTGPSLLMKALQAGTPGLTTLQ